MSLRVTEEEFVKKVAPLVCVEGKKFQRMQAQQTYMVLRGAGFVIVDKKKLREEIRKGQRFRENDSLMGQMPWVEKLKEILGE